MNLVGSNFDFEDSDIEIADYEICTPRNFISKSEGRLIASNQKFLAMVPKSGKEILIIEPNNNSINIKSDLPKISCDSIICHLEFSPFNNNILASGHEDKSLLLWKIPEEGLKKNITKEYISLKKNNDKVNFIEFNPISSEVLFSSSNCGDIYVWNLEKKDSFGFLNLGSYPTSVSWNPHGDLIGATTYLKNFYIFDPRNNSSTTFQKQISDQYNSKFIWVDNNTFLTISLNKEGKDKLLKLWDIKRYDKEISSKKIYSSINISTPREMRTVRRLC